MHVEDAEDLLVKVRGAYSKPGEFLNDMKRRARRLPATHLPSFWDTVGQRLAGSAPQQAAFAYGLAREAERTHWLRVDVDFRVENTMLFARNGALAGKEVRVHQEWLGSVFPAKQAHQEFLRFIRAWQEGGAPPAADLHTRLRASAKAAGLGDEEVAAVLGEALAAAKGLEVPDRLLDGAAKLLAKHPPGDKVRQGLVDLFPPTNTGGAAFLRLLRDSGTIEAMADGRVTPDGGLARWLGHFTYLYSCQRQPGGGVMQCPLPDELYEVVPVLAPRLRADGEPARLHEGRYKWATFDADLVDACLAEGVPVENPGPRKRMKVWRERSRRNLRALAADPALGRLLEREMHPQRGGSSINTSLPRAPGSSTAITRLPSAPQIADRVWERVVQFVGRVADSGLETAGESVADLDRMLDTPTVLALEGIGEELAALDLIGPLLRTLRAGLPDELGWPALDSAAEELTAGGGRIAGVTSTWPVLTLFTAGRAIAIDHMGRGPPGVTWRCTATTPTTARCCGRRTGSRAPGRCCRRPRSGISSSRVTRMRPGPCVVSSRKRCGTFWTPHAVVKPASGTC
jgi:hypothetical protein